MEVRYLTPKRRPSSRRLSRRKSGTTPPAISRPVHVKSQPFPEKTVLPFLQPFPGRFPTANPDRLPDRPCGGCDLGHQKRWLVLYSVEAIWWIRSMMAITSHRFSLRSLAQVLSSVLTCVLMSSETAERAALYRGAISLQNASVSGFLISLTAHSFCIS